MKGKLFLALLVAPLIAAGPPLPLQELKLNQEALEEQVRHQKSELALVHEKLEGLKALVEALQGGDSSKPTTSLVEKRLLALETALAKSQERLQMLDKQLSCELKTLKASLESMVAFLQKGETKSYVVKSGDSLGKIALDHQTTLKKLKELNNLSSDQITVGQKLEIP